MGRDPIVFIGDRPRRPDPDEEPGARLGQRVADHHEQQADQQHDRPCTGRIAEDRRRDDALQSDEQRHDSDPYRAQQRRGFVELVLQRLQHRRDCEDQRDEQGDTCGHQQRGQRGHRLVDFAGSVPVGRQFHPHGRDARNPEGKPCHQRDEQQIDQQQRSYLHVLSFPFRPSRCDTASGAEPIPTRPMNPCSASSSVDMLIV